MKQQDYAMKLISTYSTDHIFQLILQNAIAYILKKYVSIIFNYPEGVINHFKYWHSVDNHNANVTSFILVLI